MMQEKIKMEILDLTEDSDEEQNIKIEPRTPDKEKEEKHSPNSEPGDSSEKHSPDSEPGDSSEKHSPDSEPGDSSGFQKSPNGRFVRNIDKCIEKAVAEIKKGQSLVTVASQYGIPQEVLYSKLVSRNLPRETEILTLSEENGLVKWILKSNQNNTLIFKHQLMERVGRLKKVMNITPIFAKSKFGRMWYEYFMKNHPEIYENDGLLMPSDRLLARPVSKEDPDKRQVLNPEPEDFDILTPEEEKCLIDWIITSNKNNSLIFKYQLMRRVSKLSKVAKSTPGFAKSKFGRMWYERFLKQHQEIYENDELLLPSPNVLEETSNSWPDEDDIKLAQSKFKTSTDVVNVTKDPAAILKSYGIKEAVVVLHDFRKDLNSPYRLNGKSVYLQQSIENKIDSLKEEPSELKSETIYDVNVFKEELASESLDESGIESDKCSSINEDVPCETTIKSEHLVLHKTNTRGRKRIHERSDERPVCKACGISFCNTSKLARHMRTAHQPKEYESVKCAHCKKTCLSRKHLLTHIKNTHSTKLHECEECGRFFKFKTSLRKHQRTVHEGLDNLTNAFFCDICEKGFKYKNSLEAHIIYGHLKEKKQFSCSVCKKTFIKHSAMLRHKTRHSKIKPMACNHCSKTFSRRYILIDHMKVCHKFKKENTLQIQNGSSEEDEILD